MPSPIDPVLESLTPVDSTRTQRAPKHQHGGFRYTTHPASSSDPRTAAATASATPMESVTE